MPSIVARMTRTSERLPEDDRRVWVLLPNMTVPGDNPEDTLTTPIVAQYIDRAGGYWRWASSHKIIESNIEWWCDIPKVQVEPDYIGHTVKRERVVELLEALAEELRVPELGPQLELVRMMPEDQLCERFDLTLEQPTLWGPNHRLSVDLRVRGLPCANL